MKQRQIVIIRGVAGVGKSSFANLIAEPKKICTADDYFEDGQGNYRFVREEIGKAHEYCRKEFDNALMDDNILNIVVANTNVTMRDMSYYRMRADALGIRVTYVVLEKRHDNENIHGCDQEVIDRQHTLLINNLKLK